MLEPGIAYAHAMNRGKRQQTQTIIISLTNSKVPELFLPTCSLAANFGVQIAQDNFNMRTGQVVVCFLLGFVERIFGAVIVNVRGGINSYKGYWDLSVDAKNLSVDLLV